MPQCMYLKYKWPLPEQLVAIYSLFVTPTNCQLIFISNSHGLKHFLSVAKYCVSNAKAQQLRHYKGQWDIWRYTAVGIGLTMLQTQYTHQTRNSLHHCLLYVRWRLTTIIIVILR